MSTQTKQPTTRRDAHPRPDGWWAYPVIYTGAVYITGYLPSLPWWTLALVGLALAGLGWAVARLAWPPGDYGSPVAGAVAGCLMAFGAGTGVWLVAAQLYGPLAVWQYLAAGGGFGWAWWALVMLLAPTAAAQVDALWAPTPTAAAPADDDDPKRAQYRKVLARLVPDVEVLDVTTSPSGGVDTVRLAPVDGRDITRAMFESKLPRIVAALARQFASQGTDLQDEDVTVEGGRNAADWHMLVTTTRVLARTIPYEPATGPQPWVGPKQLGYWEDDRPLELTLCHAEKGAAHGDIVMETGGGKTNTLNVVIRRHLESDECEVWLVGVEKLTKLAWMWLLPWLRGETDRPVIDRVAGESIEAALRALADAYQYTVLSNRKQRGNKARRPERGKGGLVLVLDEKSYLLKQNQVVIKCFDGVERNASQLVAALVKLGRTAPVSVISANQDKLMNSAGNEGAEQSRNQAVGIIGKVNSSYDAYAAVPGLSPRMNPMKLTDNAIYLVSPHDPRREVRGKFFYIDDDDIPPAARELTRYRYGLDPAITSQLRFYADRWDPRWHAEYIAELADEPDLRWPVGPGVAGVPRTGVAPAAATAQGDAPATIEAPALALVPGPTPEPEPEPTEATTMPDDTPPEGLPDGWTDPQFDVWEALGVADATESPVRVNEAAAAAGDPSGIFQSDTSEIEAALAKMRAWHAENAPRRKPVGEPLESVLFILAKPGAPEWVPTEVLALAIGRITPDMEAGERVQAVAQMGLELWRQTQIKSEQLRKEHDERQRKGYRVADLVAAGRRLSEAA